MGSECLGRLVSSVDARPPSLVLGVSSHMDGHSLLCCTPSPLTGMSLCQTLTLPMWTQTLLNYTTWFPTPNLIPPLTHWRSALVVADDRSVSPSDDDTSLGISSNPRFAHTDSTRGLLGSPC